MNEFVKISQLDPDSKSEVKKYFTELYGPEYANAMVEDFSTAKKDAVSTKGK